MLFRRRVAPDLAAIPFEVSNITQANAFAPNWGQTIFQSASEMAQNNHIRERLGEIMARAPEEKEWWDKRKETIQADFMKELDDEKVKSSEDDAVMVEAGGPAGTVGKGGKKAKA